MPTLMLSAADTSLCFYFYGNNNFSVVRTTNMVICAVATCSEIKVFACSVFQKTLS